MTAGSAAGTRPGSAPLPDGFRSAADGRDSAEVERALLAWASAPPMRALAAESGWDWPAATGARTLFGRLADLSADWDFRRSRERSHIERAPALVNGRTLPDDFVADAAHALGFGSAARSSADGEPDDISLRWAGRGFSHLVVLSGQAWACVNRVHHAARLLDGGLRAGLVTVLGAHRQMVAVEQEQAARAGLGRCRDEADATLATARLLFSLGPPLTAAESAPPPSPDEPAAFHGGHARYQWPSAEVVIAPSEEPAVRRAKTGDQLRYWAELHRIGPADDVLILTTQIYLPYQHLVACRVLGLDRGCGVYACGVAAGSALLPVRTFGGREYLQELRAALRAGRTLLEQVQP